MPTDFCPGCGHGMLLNVFVHSLESTILEPKKLVVVSGPGCAGWISSRYLAFDTIAAPSGMAVSIAMGIKYANSDLKVVVICGESELSNENLSTLIHAARRGARIMVICAHNATSGLLAGMVAPTTPIGSATHNQPQGNTHNPLDYCKTVIGAGAHYVARFPLTHSKQVLRSFKNGFLARGLSFLEILTICPQEYGRRNQRSAASEMLRALRLGCVPGDIMTNSSQRGFSEPIFIGEYVKR